MTKAVIFDLDSCLSAADEPGRELFQPAFDAIARANFGTHTPEMLDAAFTDMWRLPFDFVAEKHRFTPAMRDAGWKMFSTLEVTTPMRGYGDLEALADVVAKRFLVTSGFRRLQESKIRALGVAPLFAGVYVDAIDEMRPRGKQALIEEIMKSHGLTPPEVLIVGDNADSEIAAGIRLGIRTVQTLRPGVPYAASAQHHIRNLSELPRLL